MTEALLIAFGSTLAIVGGVIADYLRTRREGIRAVRALLLELAENEARAELGTVNLFQRAGFTVARQVWDGSRHVLVSRVRFADLRELQALYGRMAMMENAAARGLYNARDTNAPEFAAVIAGSEAIRRSIEPKARSLPQVVLPALRPKAETEPRPGP